MKKILHIQVLPKLSGVQKISLEILKQLPDNEYEKWILFSDTLDVGNREACESAFCNVGVKVLFSKNLRRSIVFKDLTAFWELYCLCRREKFDIVHTHSTKPGIIGRLAATLAGVPSVIHTVHGLSFHKFISFPRWQFYWFCEMFASLFCCRIVLVNKFYMRYFHWFKRKTLTIYNGVDFSDFDHSFIRNYENDRISILFVGRLDIAKNPLMFLRVADLLINTKGYLNVHFVMVGDGELYEECQKYIVDHSLDKYVELIGWKDDVSQYYKSCDIFAMTSIYESFGLIFLEAGFYGMPTVATDVEGIPEIVQDRKTGLLSVPNDVETFASHIELLIHDKALRRSLGENAKKYIMNFDARKMSDEYLKLYNM